jgi:hypothetical protein
VERENPEDISRIPYAVADNTFSVIVTGETAIDVPHGADILQLGLTEVLDALDVSFPPISSSKLDEKGSMTAFSDVGCSIRGPDGQGMGEGPWNSNGLGAKEHEPGQAHAKAETPPVDCLDCRMGHITPLVAQEVEKGCTTGVQLESTSPGRMNYRRVRSPLRATWSCLLYVNRRQRRFARTSRVEIS